MIEKYPYKKILALDWYEAAIGHLLFFKSLKERMNNNGILLKAATPDILRQSEDEINKFFNTAKIQQLDLTHSSQFYQKLLEDIKGLTNKLKDNKDCPYINLVYSEKIKQSCLALRKYGYNKPYEIWEQWERDKKGFCFLIVRPEYRWKQIANSVYNLVKKRQSSMHKPLSETKIWTIQLSYEKFLWLYLRKEFKEYRQHIEIKEKKNENIVTIAVSRQLSYLNELEKQIDKLNYLVVEEPAVNLRQLIENLEIELLSPIELEKITQILYHEFGISNIVRRLRQINGYLMVGPMDLELWMVKKQDQFKYETLVEGLHKINPLQIKVIHKYGRRTDVIEYQSMRYLSKRFEVPLKPNLKNLLKTRCSSIPKYYFYYQRDNYVYLMRHFYLTDIGSYLLEATPLDKIRIAYSVSRIIKHLHSVEISIARNFRDALYLEGGRVVADCAEESDKSLDITELKFLIKEAKDSFDPKDHAEIGLMESLQKQLDKHQFELDTVCDLLEKFQSLLM